jgi:drug/metabolite transporter (DMT)-like permease
MSSPRAVSNTTHPAAGTIVLAFALLYLSWGTTCYVIRRGVHYEGLPPALFGGLRVAAAGVLLLAYIGLRGDRLWLGVRELCWAGLGGLLLFVGGNGLLTAAMETVPSGIGAVLTAMTPLWMAVLESLLPRGDRLSAVGWFGLFVSLGGVVMLLLGLGTGEASGPATAPYRGVLMVLGSTVAWAVGALVLRYHRPTASHLGVAAYQMLLGGGALCLVGLFLGEAGHVPARLTSTAVWSFVYLLVVGSLVGFVAFNWLLRHVSAAKVGTHAYVNPVVAIVVAWLLRDGDMTLTVVGGMAVILAGVALVRRAGTRTVVEVERRAAAEGNLEEGAATAALETVADLVRP